MKTTETLQRKFLLSITYPITIYIDDIISFVRDGCQEFVLSCLSSFHNSIQFTYEIEK